MYGLTNEQVAENREKYGSNKLPEPKLKKWYHFAKDALCEKITMILIAIDGLTNEQVAENREKYGSNKLPEPKLKKWYHFAKDALCEKITMILIAIAMLQMMLGF